MALRLNCTGIYLIVDFSFLETQPKTQNCWRKNPVGGVAVRGSKSVMHGVRMAGLLLTMKANWQLLFLSSSGVHLVGMES